LPFISTAARSPVRNAASSPVSANVNTPLADMPPHETVAFACAPSIGSHRTKSCSAALGTSRHSASQVTRHARSMLSPRWSNSGITLASTPRMLPAPLPKESSPSNGTPYKDDEISA